MIESIDRLAHCVNEAWAAAAYDAVALPGLAAHELAGLLQIDFGSLAARIFSGMELPAQRRKDQNFGQPALTLYSDDRFLIEALCWHSGTPAIHHHSFAGAFRQLTGRSVHCLYDFAEDECIDGISLGSLRRAGFELLDSGTVVAIPPGPELIHSSFHLDSPSMTLVIRSHQSGEPELTYLPPGVAYDSARRSEPLHKRLQLLDTLSMTQHPEYLACLTAGLENSGLYEGMALLLRAGAHGIDTPTYVDVTQKLQEIHGVRHQTLIDALIEERRRSTLVRKRAAIRDPEARYFLACLITVTSRDELLDAMAAQYHDASTVRDRIGQGVASLLGGNEETQTVAVAAVHAILDGVPPSGFASWLARSWQCTFSDGERERLQRFHLNLIGSELLGPLNAGTRNTLERGE